MTAAMMVGGRSVPATERFEVRNPATAAVFASAPDCSREQLEVAMRAAESAFATWAADEPARRAVLRAARDAVLAAEEELAHLLTAEQGKPLAKARVEVRGSAAWLDYYAELEPPEEVIRDDARARVLLMHRPLGVVAAITPWNFPLQLSVMKVAPALRGGNTVVLKPSPFTPLTALRFGELLAGVVPPGVLNVVSGRDPLGAWMTRHPVPRKVSFTGSVATGKRVAEAVGGDLKRVTLELGGNDPAVVLDDVDPATIAERLFWAAFANNGQVCAAVKRLYVPRRAHAAMVEALAAIAKSVHVGAGLEEGVQLGPVNNQPQLDRVAGLVEDARRAGATVATGGDRLDRPGYFYAPTIVADISDGNRLVDEEQFGPALPVIAYDDLDDAIARANNTHFGLSGSVWGVDLDRAAAVAARLEVGTSWVNSHLAVGPDLPISGAKWSGLGVENGLLGLYAYTDVQVLHRPCHPLVAP